MFEHASLKIKVRAYLTPGVRVLAPSPSGYLICRWERISCKKRSRIPKIPNLWMFISTEACGWKYFEGKFTILRDFFFLHFYCKCCGKCVDNSHFDHIPGKFRIVSSIGRWWEMHSGICTFLRQPFYYLCVHTDFTYQLLYIATTTFTTLFMYIGKATNQENVVWCKVLSLVGQRSHFYQRDVLSQ